jgi:hypothetical protein
LTTSHHRIITSGRAYVRLIEAADALLGYRPAWTEALLSRRLRELIGALPAEMEGQRFWRRVRGSRGRCGRLGGIEVVAEHAGSGRGVNGGEERLQLGRQAAIR